MPSSLEHKLEALARAAELMRPFYLRMRNAVEEGNASEEVARLTKKDIIRICQWRYGWWTLYNKLVDKYGLYYLRQGPNKQRNYTFKANVLSEIEQGTTPLLPDEVDLFLDRLIGRQSSGGRTGAQSPRRLAGISSSMALVLIKDRAEANKYLKQLSAYALKVKTNLGAEPEDQMFIGAYIDDIYDFGQGDPFEHEGDIDEW